MEQARPLNKLSRQDLYDLIWTTPAIKLAGEFNISDVAIAKRCRKLNVPKPPPGYWARIEAGQKPKRPPLPVLPDKIDPPEIQIPETKTFSLPTDSDALLPLADELMKALGKAKPSHDKRVFLRERTLPETSVSKTLASRVAKAFHVLLKAVEPQGIPFRRSQSAYDGGYFQKGYDRVYIKIEEDLTPDPKSSRRRSIYTSWPENRVPGGKLRFALNTERYSSATEKKWEETDKVSLETILAEMARFICKHYVEMRKRREAEKIEQLKRHEEHLVWLKKHQEEEARREEEESKKAHADALSEAQSHRKKDLAKAAEWWRLYRNNQEFISECERRWLENQNGTLSPEQTKWLAWAQDTAKALSPFETGYPDPALDGEFDPTAVPFGGPYPETRKFPKPPTMPKIPAPVVVKPSYGQPEPSPAPNPYPFWLKNR